MMFREKIGLKDLEKMDAEYRDLLARVLTIQADCEIGGPHLYVKDILPAAPSKNDQLVGGRAAAGGHGRGHLAGLERAESRALSRRLSRAHPHVGGLLGVRLFDRPRGALS